MVSEIRVNICKGNAHGKIYLNFKYVMMNISTVQNPQ